MKLHPHVVTEKSLAYVHDVWNSLSRHFSVPSVKAVLEHMPSIDVEADCISATLSSKTNRGLKKIMKGNVQYMEKFMQENDIIEMIFDDGLTA